MTSNQQLPALNYAPNVRASRYIMPEITAHIDSLSRAELERMKAACLAEIVLCTVNGWTNRAESLAFEVQYIGARLS